MFKTGKKTTEETSEKIEKAESTKSEKSKTEKPKSEKKSPEKPKVDKKSTETTHIDEKSKDGTESVKEDGKLGIKERGEKKDFLNYIGILDKIDLHTL